MKHEYKTQNTCSTKIEFELDGNVVKDIQFVGGCSGNLKALQVLLEGHTVEEIEEKCGGIMCGHRPTSCADQLSKAVRMAYDSASN